MHISLPDKGSMCRDDEGSVEVPSGNPWSLRISEVFTEPSPLESNGYGEAFLFIQYEVLSALYDQTQTLLNRLPVITVNQVQTLIYLGP